VSEPLPEPQRTAEREALAKAIAQLARARDRLARAKEAYARLDLHGPNSADRQRERAERALVEARERAPHLMVAQLLDTPTRGALSVETAEEALKAAIQTAEATERARGLLVEEERAAEQEIELAVGWRDMALIAVLQAASELAALWDRYQAARQNVRDIAWCLSAVGIHRLPLTCRWDGLVEGVDRGHGTTWKEAIAALEQDADVSLPSE
jgi:hypothetical protein